MPPAKPPASWVPHSALNVTPCLTDTSEIQPVVRRPVRGSSFPGSSCWVLPKLHFPAGGAAHALLRTRTLPCAEWGLCVASGSGNTAWSIPWHGTCRAGLQKHGTHQTCSEACCFCSHSCIYLPDTLPPAGPGGSLPFPPPHKSLQKMGLPKRSSPVFVSSHDESDFLPARVDGINHGRHQRGPTLPH